MDYFKKGAWIEPPMNWVHESCIKFAKSLEEPLQKFGDTVIPPVSTPTTQFRKDRELTLLELLEDINENIPESVKKEASDRMEQRIRRNYET